MKLNVFPAFIAFAIAVFFGAGILKSKDDPNLPVSKSEQSNLTPDETLSMLMEGNKRYQKGNLTDPNIEERIAEASKGQHPKAVILSCLDSRVPVEKVFDVSIGDVFVGRVAGNIENDDQIGSMEFGTKVAGSKLVMVLGHESCGAVQAACDDVRLGHISILLQKIRPAVSSVEGFEPEARNSKNKEFVDAVIKQNVIETVNDIRERSVILSAMEKAGEIKIVGAVYSLQTGEVTLLDTPVK